MFTVVKTIRTAALVLGVALVLVPASTAQCQYRIYPVNPNPLIAPGVSLKQYAYNTAVLGRAYSQVPPYLLGYNPYPSSVNYGPSYNPQVFRPAVYNPQATPLYGYGGMPYAGGYSAYGGAPYAGGYSAGGGDPYAGGYSGAPNPYYWNPYSGGYNYSSAADLMALGQVGLDEEKARILREVANQARLDTRKKIVDTLAYLRANEYTFTQEQADIAKRLLQRLQKTPTQAEIQNGKSLNVLLEDLVKFNSQQLRGPTVTLDDDVLRLVNIAGAGSSGNIGLLRDNGRFAWPSAFDKKEVASEKERKDVELEAAQLYVQASNGQVDANLLRNVESSLQTLRANLTKQANNVQSQNYLEGLRFLDAFDSAVVAIKKGDVVLNQDFQKFIKGGKNVQDLVDYMGKRGLRFAGASSGDERAYVALQAALSAQSLAIHSQIAAAGKN